MAKEPIISRMSVAGHPMHPMLIHFPVAFLLGLVGADLAFLYTADPFWARVGLWLAGLGSLGGWLAGLAGLVDLVFVPRIRNLIIAWSHALMAVMTLSLASFNWLLRYNDENVFDPWGLYISLLTAALITVTSVLGGQMVYHHAVGVHIDS
ncbi:MAG: DUF2231 domain-containing protein [Methylicorpusculum sp.]|uniref:DUF2231 domain-containing protein n=1 Tax=Methylicorpusculum sp. TaxID=2713644 RepID=UPI00271C9816|nr:DUF2231 domain-containing protein [Methylicorpusculum sp.]MDO8939489.1 DUF2231 domain-containing protein [Methylicorpusculum sp.]MDP2200630.1 DUF2231 domain-containing protein [Methylicorpusculum sp.]